MKKKLKKCNKGGAVTNTGYKKNSPDKNNSFNIIPSGNITMQDVDFPILGIDNYGNQQYMFPGQDYSFPGDYVTEIPMKQNGGQLTPKSFYDQYLNSPKYKERLIKMGHINPNQVIKDRKDVLRNTDIINIPDIGSQYMFDENTIVLDPKEINKYNFNKDLVLAHEYSHALGSSLNKNQKKTLQLNSKEANELYNRNLLRKQPEPKNEELKYHWYHDQKPSEAKSDIDALRYRLRKDGLYDTGTQEFNQKHLNEAKKRYSKDKILNRNFKGYSDKDLIFLMNNIAYNNVENSDVLNPDLMYLKYGGENMKKLKKKQFGGITDPNSYDYDPAITPFFDYETGVVPTNGGTQPPSNTQRKPSFSKFMGMVNSGFNQVGNNLMADLTNPYSFQNIAGYTQGAVNFFDNNRRNREREEWLRTQMNTDSFMPVLPGNDRGDYVNTGSAYGMFRPNQMGFQSQGMFQKGGQVKPIQLKKVTVTGKDPYEGIYDPKTSKHPQEYKDAQHPDYYHRRSDMPIAMPNRNHVRTYADSLRLYNIGEQNHKFHNAKRIRPTSNRDWQEEFTINEFFNRANGANNSVAETNSYIGKGIVPQEMRVTPAGTTYYRYKKPTTPPGSNKPVTKSVPKRETVAPTTVTAEDVYPEIPTDLEWHDGLVPTENTNRYGYGIYSQPNLQQKTMSAEELDYIRKTLNAPQLYTNGQTRDQLRGSDTGAEVEALLKKYREGKNLPKQEYGGQAGFSLDLKHRYKIYPDENPTSNSLSNFIKPVDRDEANIEAEKGETVFGDFDQDGIYEHMEIGGNKHYNGGTPLNVPLDSFIFSDAKKLKIGGDILTSFGKPEGTKNKYTPAELAKQYKINKFKNVLDDPNMDDPIKLRTSELMIDNYNKKLSKLALVQESIKGFPNGIPAVAFPYLEGTSMGNMETAPDSEQIFKYGGSLPKALYGINDELIIDPYAGGKTQAGRTTPTGQNNKYNRGNAYLQQWDALIPGISSMPNKQAQSLIYDYTLKNNPQAIDNMWLNYGLTDKGMRNKDLKALSNNGKFTPESMTADNRNKLKDAYVDGYFGVRQLDPTSTLNTNQIAPRVGLSRPNPQQEQVSFDQPIPSGLNPNTFAPKEPQSAPTGFWAQDKINTFSALNNRANLNKYLPWAAPITAENVDPTFYDPNRELAANAENMNTQMMFNANFSGPQALGARNSEVAGNSAVNAANILARYNNQNVGVANQFETINTEINNRLADAQAQRANNLYNGTVIANQQFDNERAQANEVIRKNLVGALTNSQQTQWMNEWYPQYNLDPSTGRFYFDRGKPSIDPNARTSGEQTNFIEMFNKLKRENPNTPDEVIRKQIEMMMGSPARNTVDSQGNMRSTYQGSVPPYLQAIAQTLGQ